MMLKIGVTGGIGAGKSLICRVFSVLGVPVYNADIRARLLMDKDLMLHRELKKAFGQSIFSDGKPNRKILSGIVFNDPDALDRLNGIVHPAVRRDFIRWTGQQSESPYLIKEAAILFETGTYKELDTVILVTAPESIRIKRVSGRDGETEEAVRNRMASQWPDDRKSSLAGIILRNDNSEPILPVILHLHEKFRSGGIAGV